MAKVLTIPPVKSFKAHHCELREDLETLRGSEVAGKKQKTPIAESRGRSIPTSVPAFASPVVEKNLLEQKPPKLISGNALVRARALEKIIPASEVLERDFRVRNCGRKESSCGKNVTCFDISLDSELLAC